MSEKDNQLQKILDEILEDKNANLTPKNLKKGVTCLGIKGNYYGEDTSDATVTAKDILEGKTTYIEGEKVVGTMPNIGEKNIVPSINYNQSISTNGYVTKITTPSVKNIIASNSITNLKTVNCSGGGENTKLSMSINSKIGCRVYAIVVAREEINVTRGWELFQSIVTSPSNGEMWYQTMYIYEKLAESTEESFSVSQTNNSLLALTMLSFDTSETMYVEWLKSNVTEQVTSVTINDNLKENDFLLVTHIQDNEESDKNNVSIDNVGNIKYITSEDYIPKLTLFKINENANIANIKFATATEYAIILLRFNTALRPENIRANIKIMDIIGNLSEDDMSKIKYFKSVSELNASTDNKEGDFAAVIDDNDNFIGFYKYENEQWEKQTVDTDDATAAATDIANGKTAYAKGEKVTGIVPVITGLTSDYVPSEGVGKYGSYIYGLAKPAGRNNMQTTMYRAASTLNVLLPQNSIATVSGLTADVLKKDTKVLGIIGNYEGTVTSDADATAGDIMEGKTAYVKGKKITGTVAPISSINMGNAKSAYVPTEDLTSLILNTTITDRGILGQNIDYQIKANGSQITNAVGLTPEILKKGINILGMEGTFDSNPEAYNAKFETAGKTEGLTPLTMLIAIDKIDTANVVNASNIFIGCSSLKSLPPMDLGNATTMNYMCQGCTNLMSMPEISIPNVTSLINTFCQCRNISIINLINTSNKIRNIDGIFYNCINITSMPNINYRGLAYANQAFTSSGLKGVVDLSVLNPDNLEQKQPSKHFFNMFQYCKDVTQFDGYNIDSGNNSSGMGGMFSNCTNLQIVSNCNFHNILYTNSMFENCENLIGFNDCSIQLHSINGYYKQNSYRMFANCYNLTNIPNSIWSNLNSSDYGRMFYNCQNLQFPNEITLHLQNMYSGGMNSMFERM